MIHPFTMLSITTSGKKQYVLRMRNHAQTGTLEERL